MKIIPDHINALFIFCGAGFLFLNVLKIYKDKCLKGYNWLATIFFSSLGIWNLFFFSHLEQWWSFAGTIAIVTVNTFWLGQIFYYNNIYKKGE